MAMEETSHSGRRKHHAVNTEESTAKGQGDEDPDAVRVVRECFAAKPANGSRGLDNAGKTTIVKQIMKEDVNTVSPTLGFIIKTIDYGGYVGSTPIDVEGERESSTANRSRYKLNICTVCVLIIVNHKADCAGDVGGQKTLRTYWKNYFEKTDTLIWVVDATDRERIDDCRRELAGLLQEEVWTRREAALCRLTVDSDSQEQACLC